MFNFVADRIISGRMYPALARHSALPFTPEWREFTQHWPRTVPLELPQYAELWNYPTACYQIDQAWPESSWYPIALGWFDFELDYFAILPTQVQSLVKQGRLKILFYYHEGDNPQHINHRLSALCKQHGLDIDCWRFVSANGLAQSLPNFAYIDAHELIYWHRNRHHGALPVSMDTRPYVFTVLNRTHKWWRATVMAQLWQQGLLNHSQWSYNIDLALGDDRQHNPIQEYALGLDATTDAFLATGSHQCDSLSAQAHNDHHMLCPELFQQSYCHIVIETHFDADGSQSPFITEKTFKVLKHGQPFVIVGTPGTLARLRQLGYRTFDHVIDSSYDSILDNTQRWLAVNRVISTVAQNPKQIFEQCRDDIIHNQQLFVSSKYNRLENLSQQLYEKT